MNVNIRFCIAISFYLGICNFAQAANSASGQKVIVTTLAGSFKMGNADGKGTRASFVHPSGVAVDRDGNVYVVDSGNLRIRKITGNGSVTTMAGGGAWRNKSGDGNGTLAAFHYSTGVAVDENANVYVAEACGNRVRKISPTGDVTTLAGGGGSGRNGGGYADGDGSYAAFDYSSGVAVDGSGNVYVADNHNRRIRKITPSGTVTTLAGSGAHGFIDGQGTAAAFALPSGVAVDDNGIVYVADMRNNRIRKITPDGTVTTLAGSGVKGFADGNGKSASFNEPRGVAVDRSGNVYIADRDNHRIRKITISK